MSALYSWTKPDNRQVVTRRGHQHIEATLASWEGSVTIELNRDGSYRVTVGPHPTGYNGAGPRIVVAQGSVKADERDAITSDLA
jgi:hypothetical protein